MFLYLSFIFFAFFITTRATQRHDNFSPKSRTLHPVSIYQTTGNVTPAGGPTQEPAYAHSVFVLTGPNASVTYDFGQLVAGQPSFNFKSSICDGSPCSSYGLPAFNCTGECQGLRLGYTESPLFVNEWGGTDWTTWYTFPDGPLYLPLNQLGLYTVPGRWARGSFRYLTLSLDPEAANRTVVSFEFDSLRFTAAPNIEDDCGLGSYTGYFKSSDELLNQIWNAGVYTVQLNTMSANTSLNISYFLFGNGWANDATSTSLSASDVFIADGAKRNRNPWSADYSIFFRTALVSQNYDNMRASRNGIQANFILQDLNSSSESYGYFPYAGSPLGDAFRDIEALGFPLYSSDTYQCWAMLSLMEYFKTTGDLEWTEKYWPQFLLGINATFAFLDPDTGLFNGTRTVDWGRDGQGDENIALNVLYYHTLITAAKVAPKLSSSASANTTLWRSIAESIKQSANSLLWDEEAGLFRDNTTAAGSQVHPQDGNSFAIRYNFTTSQDQSRRIATALSRRWTTYGAPSVELRGFISPFATSHELLAQFAARPGEPSPALDLMRTQWGYMLRAFSNETFIEGYGADGSLGYAFYGDAPAFISFAHAFSTGPTYALTTYVAGLRVVKGLDVEDGEGDWVWMPGVKGSGLDWVKSGFVAPGDRTFGVQWRVNEEKGWFEGHILAPEGEVGTVYVPVLGDCNTTLLFVNNTEVDDAKADTSGKYYRLPGVPGGKTVVRLKQSHA